MAELIPFEYRVRVVQRVTIVRWSIYGMVALIAAAAGLLCIFTWQHRQNDALAELQAEYKQRCTLIFRSQELRTKRENLATRMKGIQQLRDDKVLLALLHNISTGFSEHDCLEQVHIDARGGNAGRAEGEYTVKLIGVTSDSSSLADLMKRLAAQNQPAVSVILEQSKREVYLDGHVMRFQILCEKPGAKG